MRVYVLLGPPGAGKGTVAPIIAEQTPLLHVSTGHKIRELMRDVDSELGRRCFPFMDRRDYVPDDLMLEIIQLILKEAEGRDILLDGFPRSAPQAADLDRLVQEADGRVEAMLLMEIGIEVAIERCGLRLTCPECGAVFHRMVRPPKQAGLCDVCQATLFLRDDDTPDLVRRRFEHFENAVEEITAYYEAKNMVRRIDAGPDVDSVVAQVICEVQ